VCNLVGDCVGECAAQLVSVQLGTSLQAKPQTPSAYM
jgi:hypothetical protein